MSTQPTPQVKMPKTEFVRWTYINPSSGTSFAAHHAKEAAERLLRKEASLCDGLFKDSTAPVAPSEEFLENKCLETKVLQSEWVIICESEEWDMMPEIEKTLAKKVGKESKVVGLVVGWVSGQK